MQKVSFLTPPAINGGRIPERVFGCTYGLYAIPNIFILTYAAILREAGHLVKVRDAPVEGMKVKDFLPYLENDDSDIYIFYSVNLSKEQDRLAVENIRTSSRNKFVIFCGPAPAWDPEYFLFDDRCFTVRGEGDFTIRDLVDYFDGRLKGSLENITGITFRDHQGRIIHTHYRELIEDLDVLPVPARDLIRRDLYYNPKLKERPFTAMLTTRGCPFQCTYCVPCSLSFATKLEYNRHKKTVNSVPKVRFRSAGKVIEEFRALSEQGYRTVSIIDDEFVLDKKRTVEICEGIKSLKMRWGCLARADSLVDDEVVRAMAYSGCVYTDIGIESFSQDILDDVKKGIKLETFYEAMKILKMNGIAPKLNILIAASSLETAETIKKTIRESIRLEPDMVMFSICNPFPGTEFYQKARENGWLVYKDYVPVDVQKKSIIEYPHLKKGQIERLVRKANFRFFLNPRFILKNIFRFKTPKDFFLAFKSLIKKLTGW